jgi:mannose-6-phosphate isomerase-like protein (cupin superfamily)
MDTLATWAGLTKGYLSKIERGLKTPPISTLSRLAEALGVEIADLFPRQPNSVKCAIVRRDQRRAITRDGAAFGYFYESIAYPKTKRAMEPFIITLVPTREETPIMAHDGEEIVFVLQGRLEFLYDGRREVLEEGDCAYFDSGQPHRAKAVGEEEAKALLVILPAKKG